MLGASNCAWKGNTPAQFHQDLQARYPHALAPTSPCSSCAVLICIHIIHILMQVFFLDATSRMSHFHEFGHSLHDKAWHDFQAWKCRLPMVLELGMADRDRALCLSTMPEGMQTHLSSREPWLWSSRVLPVLSLDETRFDE